MSLASRRRRGIDFWPGFVDALSSLLMVLIFMLLIFTIGQFVLSDALTGRDKALAQLNAELAQLAKTLSMEQSAKTTALTQVNELSASLAQTGGERDALRLSDDPDQIGKLTMVVQEITRHPGFQPRPGRGRRTSWPARSRRTGRPFSRAPGHWLPAAP